MQRFIRSNRINNNEDIRSIYNSIIFISFTYKRLPVLSESYLKYRLNL